MWERVPASAVYSRDARYAYIFGRDGGLTKVDILCGKIVKRVIQGGNSIGGAISQDGSLIAVSNYKPGGVKIFSAEDLRPSDYRCWRELRAQLQQREECRRQQWRFRKDPAVYLAALEAQLVT